MVIDVYKRQIPVTPTSTSEIGNANQVKRKSISDSSQKIGIRQQIWRITDKKRLIFPFPIAWKKTGVISENTAGIKLAPMIGNAFFPIAMTSLLFEKTWSSCTGKKTKQITPTSINTQENP